MKPGDDSRLWIVVGALGGLALGFMLIPLRSLTSASNLAFVFMAFTIVVAELGGRSAALVTAVVSAFTLNFFLTEPYMSLHDQQGGRRGGLRRPGRVRAHRRGIRQAARADVRAGGARGR